MVSATFSLSKREQISNSVTPSPNQYQSEKFYSHQKPPAYTFTQQKRKFFKDIQNIPGAGAYNIPNTAPGPKYHIAGKFPENKFLSLSGPQTYNPNYSCTINKRPAYSFSGRYSNEKKYNTPGPADYNTQLNQSFDSNKSVIIGQAKRLGLSQSIEIPGPGQYNPQVQLKKRPCYSFTRSSRKEDSQQSTPGPSNYNNLISDINKKGIKISLAKRDLDKKNDLGPGPGQYDYHDLKKKNPRVVFTTAKRDINKRLYSPGPSEYSSIDMNTIRSRPKTAVQILLMQYLIEAQDLQKGNTIVKIDILLVLELMMLSSNIDRLMQIKNKQYQWERQKSKVRSSRYLDPKVTIQIMNIQNKKSRKQHLDKVKEIHNKQISRIYQDLEHITWRKKENINFRKLLVLLCLRLKYEKRDLQTQNNKELCQWDMNAKFFNNQKQNNQDQSNKQIRQNDT